MANRYTSSWQHVTNGGETTHTVPASQTVFDTEVRWRGIYEQYQVRDHATNQSTESRFIGFGNTMTVNIQTPSPAPFTGNHTYYGTASIEGTGMTYDYSLTDNSGNVIAHEEGITAGQQFQFQYGASDSSLSLSVTGRDQNEGNEVTVSLSATVEWTETKNRVTEHPTTTLNGGDSAAAGQLGANELSPWLSISGISTGANTFAHSIGGSAEAEFQFRYTYSDSKAVPTGVYADTTGSQIAGATVQSSPTAAHADTVAALPDLPGDPDGWRVVLKTDSGETRLLEADEHMSVQIECEHTAAWGGTVELPPIIDLDNYRGGSMELRYNGVLRLRCPELSERTQGNDGTLTISGLGPAVELKERSVDREFDNVFAHRAVRQLLIEDAGLSESQVSVFRPPAKPVSGELVQSADTRAGFEDVLSDQPRNESGQFVSTGGELPDWLATDPFTWEGGYPKVTQTLQFREAESDTATTGTVTTANNSSGGSVVQFVDPADRGDYPVQFGHDIPEGKMGVSIRAKSESITGNGTTTLRVTAGDRELFSVPAGEYLTGQGFMWAHFDTGFTPGTDEFELSISVSSSGEQRLDVDCFAVYDARFNYHFDNQTDMADALAGPELYPDAAPLTVKPAPTGIGLDSATVTVEMDRAGAADTVGVSYTGGNVSSSSSITGTTGTHTAQFGATTARVRPLVSLSRYSDGRMETPTQGNQGQRLMSIETRISGNAIPVIDNRDFSATTVFDAVQSLCNDYDFNWVIEHGNERGYLFIEVFQRGDERLRRELPPEAHVLESDESAAVENYANVVTVVGAERPNLPGRFEWTEEAPEEIDSFGREPIRIENDGLESVNDCRSVARATLAARLDEDDYGGSLSVTPSLVEPGYPYHVPEWEDHTDYQPPGWGNFAWGIAPWGGYRDVYATLESSSFSESRDSTDTGLDFSVRSNVLAAFAGGL